MGTKGVRMEGVRARCARAMRPRSLRGALTLPVDSTTMTVMEIVIRQTPPSIPAAPMRAKFPGEVWRLVMPSVSPTRRPRAAPDMIHGTKRPEGNAKPYVISPKPAPASGTTG